MNRTRRTRIAAADAQPPVVGEGLLRPLDRLFQRLANALRDAIPDAHNPIINSGAVANLALFIAIVSGILLLIWYTPSHTGAWASTQAMAEAPFTAGLVRSIHRYASDATLLFAALHGLQMFAGRRFAGPRWVAWLTGILSVGMIWFIGWTGYWLVWDERAQLVAVGSARALDVLPIFTDPLSRSFITNASVSSLLFFVVFFMHMLLPLLVGLFLWLHLTRLARPRFLVSKVLGAWVGATLVGLSLVAPALSAPAADMAKVPASLTMDWWYLLPVTLTDRLSGGMLWAVSLGAGALLFAVPWALVRKRRERTPVAAESGQADGHDEVCRTTGEPTPPTVTHPSGAPTNLRRGSAAYVDPARCNACETCFKDCPYDAISMVARNDGRKFPSVAWVDPARCIGCGICAGSCDSSGVGIDWLGAPAERRRMDAWLANGGDELIAFACAGSAAQPWSIDDEGRVAELPGYRVMAVPCSGWVHPLTVERALRRGAKGVVVLGCRPGTCGYREGASWTRERLGGKREPAFRRDHADASRVMHLTFDAHEAARAADEAARFRRQCLGVDEPRLQPATVPLAPPRRWRAFAFGLGVAIVGACATWLPSDLPYQTPASVEPELVVSFKIAGEVAERCRTRSSEELAALPPHKRVAKVCERSREAVRLLVGIDGRPLLERDYEPSGAFGDGASVAVETLSVPEGSHRLSIAIGPAHGDPAAFERSEREVVLRPRTRTVVVYERLAGFTWY